MCRNNTNNFTTMNRTKWIELGIIETGKGNVKESWGKERNGLK